VADIAEGAGAAEAEGFVECDAGRGAVRDVAGDLD
jgi:hypothetical protein